jgi:hypothetical protein
MLEKEGLQTVECYGGKQIGPLCHVNVFFFLFIQFVYNPCFAIRYTTGYLQYFFFAMLCY